MTENLYDDVIKPPEPLPVDEELAAKFGHLVEDAILRARPYQDEKCGTCLYYLDTDKDIAYCWHPKLRIPVGAQWWCQWWEEIAD